jgi:hypothetical protein
VALSEWVVLGVFCLVVLCASFEGSSVHVEGGDGDEW